MYAQCQVCKTEGRAVPFGVPWDNSGKAIQKLFDHFALEHPDVKLENSEIEKT